MVGDKTVDLTSQFPFVVPSKERALRLAQDPVAAADFFQFCVDCTFQHLFGWNYSTRKSNEHGGILGHLLAFFGTCEFTERGSLHGHFLIWLLGGLNPNDIHKRLKEDTEFASRFFAFFDDIIQHDLPDVEIPIDPTYEPRVERPPSPPESGSISPEKIYEWRSFMQTEVKKLGEALQRHKCKPVCHKYGNIDKCRFLFPHEIVETSHFEIDTNSVVLKCLDSMVNYFNRYILVYCRHNHDIKCILSGKAAKAAMFYISDYIAKMDIKTYQMLSLLSRAVASIPEQPEIPLRQRGRTLLHKCLAQFTRQQQIHAQQAARYLRGNNDTITSHETTPMMSGLLLDFVCSEYNINVSKKLCDDFEEEKNKEEQTFLRIQTDQAGNLIRHNQLTNYWFRDLTLLNMNFYDFTRCITLQPQSSRTTNSSNKYLLLDGHPLTQSHYLTQHTDDQREQSGKQLVPRIIGTTIPRENNCDEWMLFVLAHFKPFHISLPLIDKKKSLEDTYRSFNFSKRSKRIMMNWEEIHECQDERDEERLRKRANLTTESMAITNSLALNDPNLSFLEPDDVDVSSIPHNNSRKDFALLQAIHVLEQSHWLTTPSRHDSVIRPIITSTSSFPALSPSQLKTWMKSIKQQEHCVTQMRQNYPSTNTEFQANVINDTEHGSTYAHSYNIFLKENCPPTLSNNNAVSTPTLTPEHVTNKIGQDHDLQTATMDRISYYK
jgi:hypothetical protein